MWPSENARHIQLLLSAEGFVTLVPRVGRIGKGPKGNEEVSNETHHAAAEWEKLPPALYTQPATLSQDSCRPSITEG